MHCDGILLSSCIYFSDYIPCKEFGALGECFPFPPVLLFLSPPQKHAVNLAKAEEANQMEFCELCTFAYFLILTVSKEENK